MTDRATVDVALQGRPAWTEVMGVLIGCAVLLVVLVKLDSAAADREASRAREALAERAASAKAEPTRRRTVTEDAASESIGDRGPISLPVGSAWGPGTSTAVAHDEPVKGSAQSALRRIFGPADPVKSTIGRRPSAARNGSSSGSVDGPPYALLALFAGCGVMMSLAGTAILARTPR